MRPILAFCLLAAASCGAQAQSLDGQVSSGLNGGFAAALNGGVASGLGGTLGSTEQGRTGAQTGRRGLMFGGCAPTQFDLSNTGCRPLRERGLDVTSTYESSLQAMRPLQGMTLDGLTLDFSNGPAGPD